MMMRMIRSQIITTICMEEEKRKKIRMKLSL
jgi:hypothetical protein